MKRAGWTIAALTLCTSLSIGGVASAHSPRLQIMGTKVTDIEYLSGAEVRISVKVKVKNLADHKRDIRCGYDVFYVPDDLGLGKGTGHKAIPAMRTRAIHGSIVEEYPGVASDLAVEAHCHNN